MPLKRALKISNARIGFRNFAGKGSQFNAVGDRNFAIFLEPDQAKQLAEDGWNIKLRKPRDPSDPPLYFLKVKVAYANIPPSIWLVTETNKKLLNEGNVNVLDYAEIDNADITVTPYNWDVNGKTGVTAYVKSMYVKIVEDEFEKKYRDLPESGAAPSPEDSDTPWVE
jgi:hypothetical protein